MESCTFTPNIGRKGILYETIKRQSSRSQPRRENNLATPSPITIDVDQEEAINSSKADQSKLETSSQLGRSLNKCATQEILISMKQSQMTRSARKFYQDMIDKKNSREERLQRQKTQQNLEQDYTAKYGVYLDKERYLS